MAYADSIRAATASLTTTASLIEGLLAGYQYVSQSGVINTTATSPAAIPSLTASITVPANRIVLVGVIMNVSNSTAGNWINSSIYKNGSAFTFGAMSARDPISSTAGDMTCITNFVIDTPTAGTHTYAGYWNTQANTAYSAYRRLIVISLQNS